MNLLIDFFFFIFTIQDALAVPKISQFLKNENHLENFDFPIESLKSDKWMHKNDSRFPNLKGLVDVFQDDIASIWYNMYPMDKWRGKPEKYMLDCQEEGEYLNLCGECVGGTTEKDDNFGLDECGICHGLQRCSSNGCKEPSIESLEEEESNCTQILGMKPDVVDIADSSTKTLVNLIASDLRAKDISCTVSSADKEDVVEIKETEMGLVLKFDKPEKEGKIELACNTSEGVEFRHELLSVSSAKLKPISSDRSFLVYGQESRMIITVSNLYALTDLICFAKQNGEVVYKYWTNDIQGNSLSSEIFCERIWPSDPYEMEFGVAYSEDAIDQAQTIKVTVNTPSPKLMQTKFKEGQIIVTFDINIPPSVNCSALKESLPIGEGATCEVVANEFRITLGPGSSIKKGTRFTIDMLDSKSFTATLDELNEIESSILGPETVCAGDTVNYKLAGDGSLGANWSIGFTGNLNNAVPHGNRQRMNLQIWRNVRDQKRWSNTAEIALNTSLLIEGFEYELRATTRSGSGDPIHLAKSLTVSKQKAPLVYIKGAPKMDFKTDLMFEAQVLCLDQGNSKLTWKIGEKLIEGPKLYMKAVNFNNKIDSIAVQLTNDQQLLSQDEVKFKPMEELEPPTYIDQLVIGTGHDVEIPINKQNTEYKYTWSCNTELGKCRTPGRTSKGVEEVGLIDDTNLHIPRGMLPVGRYEIEITVSSTSGQVASKTVQLRIIPGEPPLISLTSIKTESSIEIMLRVSDIITVCELSVDSLMANNYTYIDLRKILSPDKLIGTPLNPTSKDFTVKIPENYLKFGTRYKFRLSTNCGALAQSYIVVSIPLKEIVKTGELEVSPSSGAALETPFKINMKHTASLETIYDYGFVFKDSHYFIEKKLDPTTTLYSLPGKIQAFARVCQVGKICKTVIGPEINVEGKSISPNATMEVLDSYKDAVESGMYDFAIGNAKILSESSKSTEDMYLELSMEMDQVLTKKMDTIDAMLEKDDSLIYDAIELLQSSTKIANMMQTSDESKAKMLQFRDSIQAAFRKKSGKLVQSAIMKMEPRPKRQAGGSPKGMDVDSATIKKFLDFAADQLKTSKNATQILIEKVNLMKNIPRYLKDLCNYITTTSLNANSSIAELSTTKVKNSNGNRLELDFPKCGNVCSNSTGQIILSKGFFEKFNNSDGICVGGAYLPYDYLSDISNTSNKKNIIRQSGIYMSKLFKYTQNVVIKESENASSKAFVNFRIPLWSGVQPSSDLKCYTWKDGTGWADTACKTIKPLIINAKNAVECKCPLQGIHAVFKNLNVVETTSVASVVNTNETNEITTSKPLTNATTSATTTSTTTKSNMNVTVTTTTEATKATVTQAATKANATQLPATNATVTPLAATTATTTTTPATTTKAATTVRTTQKPILPNENGYIASFVIYEDYNKTVGDRKIEFEESIKHQLIEKIKLPPETDLKAEDEKNDWIKVTMKLLGQDTNVPSVVIDMVNLLRVGNLSLKGFDNKELKVPAQNVDLFLNDKKGSSSTSYIIVISCGIFILLVSAIAILLSGVFLKWRRELRAMNFIQSMENHSRPKYLRLHESSSLEAIEPFGASNQLRPGELDSGIVLTVDPNKVSSRYQSLELMTTPT